MVPAKSINAFFEVRNVLLRDIGIPSLSRCSLGFLLMSLLIDCSSDSENRPERFDLRTGIKDIDEHVDHMTRNGRRAGKP